MPRSHLPPLPALARPPPPPPECTRGSHPFSHFLGEGGNFRRVSREDFPEKSLKRGCFKPIYRDMGYFSEASREIKKNLGWDCPGLVSDIITNPYLTHSLSKSPHFPADPADKRKRVLISPQKLITFHPTNRASKEGKKLKISHWSTNPYLNQSLHYKNRVPKISESKNVLP